ncbi:nucleoprotein [Bangoran virus]|uniref:nucleoprotein n=1 Tax=Bangoran virus TaxID=864693 RepID=UPI002481AF47|nr:nucleoprotein [Bangoran virus]UAX43316.1 nucleoprotein [Bangoran virus]
MKSIRTKEVIKYTVPGDKPVPQYPSEFFQKNPGQKPIINVPHKDIPAKTLRGIIKSGILNNNLEISYVLRFLHDEGAKIEATLDDDWDSFGINIGQKNSKVTPWDIAEIVHDQTKTPDASIDQTSTEEDVKWMLMYILFVYRYSRAQLPSYKAALFERFKIQISTYLNSKTTLVSPHSSYASWLSNKNYCKMVACFDMFFTRFPQHLDSALRFGTITSRFRDCASLTSLEHFRETVGFKGDEMFGWIFVGSLEEECFMLMKPGQELDNPFSYTPYLMDLGLSLRSPYSASTCPGMYTYCHMVGSLLASTRSQNAKMISDKNLVNVRTNALIVAYAHSENVECKLYFTDNEKLLQPGLEGQDAATSIPNVDDSSETADLDDDVPKNKNPVKWFMYLKSHKFQVPNIIKNFARNEASKMSQCRLGSIGKHLNDALL